MKIWNVRTRVRVFGTALVLLFLFSMVGFILIKRYVEGEDVTFIQALYWTVITLATLGFYPAEIALTSEIGLAFTVGVVLSGVVAIFVGAPSVIAPWLEEKLQWAQRGRRNPLPEGGHIVVVGWTDTTRHLLSELKMHGFLSVVVDDQEYEEEVEAAGYPFVGGDPTDENTLKKARLSTALGLVLTSKDEVNIFTAITARKMRGDLHIVSMARNVEAERLLYKIGANKVVAPKNAVGRMLANRALGRYEADLVEGKRLLGDLDLGQYTVPGDSILVGKNLREAGIGEKTGVVVIGMWRDGELLLPVPPGERFRAGDIIVAVGRPSQLLDLERMVTEIMGVA